MSLPTYVQVFAQVCLCGCVFWLILTSVQICMRGVCMSVCVNTCMNVCPSACLYLCMSDKVVCTHAQTQIFVCMPINECMRACSPCTCRHRYIHNCTHGHAALKQNPETRHVDVHMSLETIRIACLEDGSVLIVHACKDVHMYVCMHACMYAGR